MTKTTLLRHGYSIKHTSIGWWVDGKYGYLVAGYFPTEPQAVEAASKAIDDAKEAGISPSWLF